jgi:hypothetical protein
MFVVETKGSISPRDALRGPVAPTLTDEQTVKRYTARRVVGK